jgi:MoaA/NifB/PqqE/SkfB family radical SAM enzyme
MSFWNFNELVQVHIELTNHCNAACPMCVRFYNSSELIRPDLNLSQISLEDFKKWFPQEVLDKVKLWLFCGVHGDPCMAKDFYEICEYIIEHSEGVIAVHTNGGMRNPDWWAKLGKLFSKGKQSNQYRLTFSIDGLEDTNHIYRRNVKWDKLIANAAAFIEAGGRALWDFLIFKHNEHQLEDARILSKKMGFVEFVPKKALGVDNGTELIYMVALNKEGKLDYTIEAPVNPKNRNLENPTGTQPLKFYPFSKEEYNKMKEDNNFKNFYYKRTEEVDNIIASSKYDEHDSCTIKCKSYINDGYKTGKEIFVDSAGNVMPCCYIGTHLNGIYSDPPSMQLVRNLNNYGPEKLNLNNHSLEEILSAEHLDRLYSDTWNKTTKEGKLVYCSKTCGTFSSIDKIFTHEIVLKNRKEKYLESQKLNEN